jgi:hypothetical protein
VFATTVGGTPELLRGRGILMPPGDSPALAKALATVLTDRARAAALVEEARQWSRSHLCADGHGRSGPSRLHQAAGARMCGIAGIVSDQRPTLVRPGACARLSPTAYRTTVTTATIRSALGCNRLAIVDVAGGDQPVYYDDRSVVAVFNGEIYNFAAPVTTIAGLAVGRCNRRRYVPMGMGPGVVCPAPHLSEVRFVWTTLRPSKPQPEPRNCRHQRCRQWPYAGSASIHLLDTGHVLL